MRERTDLLVSEFVKRLESMTSEEKVEFLRQVDLALTQAAEKERSGDVPGSFLSAE